MTKKNLENEQEKYLDPMTHGKYNKHTKITKVV